MAMLAENKCLICRHYLDGTLWEHKCKAYPGGIPERIFEDNSKKKDCKSDSYSFERKRNPNK